MTSLRTWTVFLLATGLGAQAPAAQRDSSVKELQGRKQESWKAAELGALDERFGRPDTKAPTDLAVRTVSKGRWSITYRYEKDLPFDVRALFTQGRYMRDETYLFAAGKLRAVEVTESWDVDDEKEAPASNITRRYYVLPSGCWQKTFKARGELPQRPGACAPKAADELAARGSLFSSIWRLNGAAVEKAVRGLPESWFETLAVD
jgi:hypothetical protein